jgi:hypothetical protein
MQIKLFTIATFACLLTAVAATPTSPPDSTASPPPAGSGPGGSPEADFNAKVAAIKSSPEVQNTLDFLVQQIAAQLNSHP